MFKKFIHLNIGLFLTIVANIGYALGQNPEGLSKVPDNAFPATVQFSPVPSGKGWRGDKQPLTPELQRETIDNIIEHGFSVLSIGNWTKKDQTEGNNYLLNYAQSRGMKINFITGGFEIFNRDHSPAISVYSPQYALEVKKKCRIGLSSS